MRLACRTNAVEHQHRSSWVEFKFSNVQVLCLAGGTAAAAGLLWCALKKPPLFGTCVLRETLALMLPGTYSMMMERRRNSFFWEGSGRMALPNLLDFLGSEQGYGQWRWLSERHVLPGVQDAKWRGVDLSFELKTFCIKPPPRVWRLINSKVMVRRR